MIGAGPRHLLEEIVFPERLDDGNRHALLGECQRQAKADGAGPDDDDALRGQAAPLLFIGTKASPPRPWSRPPSRCGSDRTQRRWDPGISLRRTNLVRSAVL